MYLKDQCALVIGASSGIGASLCRQLGKEGYQVTMVARRESHLQDLAERINHDEGDGQALVCAHNVQNFHEIPELFNKIVESMGGLSLVIYAAGVMPEVDSDEYNFEKDRLMVEVNLLGQIAWLNQTADYFGRNNQGTIVGIGSIAGDRGRIGQPVYNTTKGAQAIYLESIRNRLFSKNVRVVTIKPGYIDTPMVAGKGNLPFMISADEAARIILRKAKSSWGEVYVPARWMWPAFILKHLPSFIFRRLGVR